MAQAKRRSRGEWADIISLHERSGLSARGFCKERSIEEASFYKWRRRLRGEAAEDTFIELGQIDKPEKHQVRGIPWQVALELGDGFTLTLRRG
jgi:hypothetical protein